MDTHTTNDLIVTLECPQVQGATHRGTQGMLGKLQDMATIIVGARVNVWLRLHTV